ncbi:enoyl-CoA hydratase/isomerase family protein [Mariniplasma anaerobium]|uniref:3-hydroxyisobutyryl-CoA hydrolase n=1 Tax=Mariniplasma anaerobium TaxID=2735436 RepID=A0A7U9XVC3_9MOLU|nr:enoyl-CoA hydratase/isomerase family protein [Mariniplasma anaerobium]BCR36811.1 3-hydroxyisobutyryl-CoA hydrolase [Mariniplasma anaerobium]
MKNMKEVMIEEINHIGIIKLNRIKALNALSLSMINDIKKALLAWENDPEIYMIYMSSLSETAFCAGGDVKKLYQHTITDDLDYVSTYLSNQYAMDYIIHTYSKPIITYVNGYIFGGGVGLAMGAKFFITSEHTKYGMPETQIGFFPDVGASYFLNKLPNQIGRYIGLLGQTLDYKDLIYLGIADYHILASNWHSIVDILYKKKWIKDDISNQLDHIFRTYNEIDEHKSDIEKHETHIDHIFSHDTIREILDHITLSDGYAKDISQKMLKLSPTALNITLELLKKGEGKDLLLCLKMEHDLSLSVVQTHDFKEGVRSLLVDKDKAFNWNPSSYKKIKIKDIKEIFKTLKEVKSHPIDKILEARNG